MSSQYSVLLSSDERVHIEETKTPQSVEASKALLAIC